jgi:hypothetical protein
VATLRKASNAVIVKGAAESADCGDGKGVVKPKDAAGAWSIWMPLCESR